MDQYSILADEIGMQLIDGKVVHRHVLQGSYFKATGAFFPVDRFLTADREHAQRVYALTGTDWARYKLQ